MKKIVLLALVVATVTISWPSTYANYLFGTFSEDNSTEEYTEIEKQKNIHIPMVGYIFDSFTTNEERILKDAVKTLGSNRIYHVSVSPVGYSSRAVADGKYDESYLRFFSVVKESGAKFAFRTMHEMNGSWFSWSGDPESFKSAWKHVYELSRKAGLDESNILFIMSVNSQDLPSVNGEMVFCSPAMKKKTNCISFEDYYPGDKYVDMMGMTLYNWGRGRSESWATWKTFSELLNDKSTKMYQRIKSYGKPLILDEVGTTAVNFKGDWSMEKVKSAYENDASYKNAWFDDMRSELSKHPELRAVMYFNRDKTSGLTDLSKIGELDWAGLSLGTKKEYASFLKFFDGTNSDIQSMPFAGYSAKKESLTVKGSSVSMTPSGMTSSIAANPYTQSVQAAINNFIKKQSSISSDKQKIAQKLIVIRDKVSIMKTQKEKSGKYTSSTKNLIEALIDALDTKVKELSV